MVHAYIQQTSYWTSCMMGHLATMFAGHESLWLFPTELPQILCVQHQPAYCSGTAYRNWSYYQRDHMLQCL